LNRRKRRKRRRAEGEKLKAEKLKLGNERQTEEGRSPGWAGRSAGGGGLAAKTRKRRKIGRRIVSQSSRSADTEEAGDEPSRTGAESTEHTEGFEQEETERTEDRGRGTGDGFYRREQRERRLLFYPRYPRDPR
jgi:hypothetical protein